MDTEPNMQTRQATFINIGERTNVTGSARFKKQQLFLLTTIL